MSTEQRVTEAHDRFYAALNRVVLGDPAAMADAWWHDETVTTMHPLGGWVRGWENVRTSWEELSAAIPDGDVEVTDLEIHVAGDVAYTLGIEHARIVFAGREVRFDSRVTNVYRCKDGIWKMVHHHPDKAPDFQSAAVR